MLLTNSVTGQPIGNVTTGVGVDRHGHRLDAAAAARTPASRSTSRIDGDGFFAVQTAEGTRYTRNGQFTADANGQLTTLQGDPVLGRDNQPIKVGDDGKVDPRLLNVVLLNNPEKEGNNFVTGTPGTVAGQTAGQVRSGVARGLGRRPHAVDGRHDRVAAGLRGRPEGHPDDRRDARQGRDRRRVAPVNARPADLPT